jgi:hypothetical protein
VCVERERAGKTETFPSFQYKFAHAEPNNVRTFSTNGVKNRQKHDFLCIGYASAKNYMTIDIFTKPVKTLE